MVIDCGLMVVWWSAVLRPVCKLERNQHLYSGFRKNVFVAWCWWYLRYPAVMSSSKQSSKTNWELTISISQIGLLDTQNTLHTILLNSQKIHKKFLTWFATYAYIDMYTQVRSDRWQYSSRLWHELSEMSDKIIVRGLNVQNNMIFRLIGWIPVTRLILKFHYLIILLRCPYARIKQVKQALWGNQTVSRTVLHQPCRRQTN